MRNAQRANAEPLLEHYASLANEAAGAVIEAAKVSVRAFDAHRWAAGAVDIVKSRRALEDAMSSQAAALNHYQALAREAGAVQAAGGCVMSTEKKVDVLATWREAAELVKACSAIDPDYVGPSPQEMAAAGEAVAELIEAATDARDTLHSCIDALSSEEQDDHDALARLTAALARAGGAT